MKPLVVPTTGPTGRANRPRAALSGRSDRMETQTLIIGGGLSGLFAAWRLAARGHDYALLEARGRLGGRILSERVRMGHFDLGPAWFWPGQPRIAGLVQSLGLTSFEQYSQGNLTFENEHGQVERGRGFASMQGSFRLEGGIGSLIDGLANDLEPERILLNDPVVQLARTDEGIDVTTGSGRILRAGRCILAMPPRVAADLSFVPALPAESIRTMREVATWMAGQAKAVAVYDHPFWREAGLSGDAISRFGPLVEIHDASASGGPFALFGFVGLPPHARRDDEVLRSQIVAQLSRLFGPDAGKPIELLLKDWANDPFTATEADCQPLYAHPHYGLPHAMTGIWDDKLLFAGTEVAPGFGGYLEGALEAADNAVGQIVDMKAA